MIIEFSKNEVQLLFNLINQVNWSGQQIEIAYELKNKIKKAIDEESIKVKKLKDDEC